MRIFTYSGSQGSGKSTLKEKLVANLRDQGKKVISEYYNVETSVSRTAKDFGFSINEETTFETQYYLALRYMVLDIETRKIAKRENVDYIVLDRSVLDVIPYTFVSNNINDKGAKLIEDILIKHFRLYPTNYVGFTSPLDQIEHVSGERSNNVIFQTNVHEQFKVLLGNPKHYPNTKIITLLNASIEERMSIIMKEI